MKKQYRKFNLEEALQGNVEVETTSGRKVKYIHLIENYVGNFPVIVVLESENQGGTDEILNYTVKGTFWFESNTSKFDLQMYDKVAVCYVNVYKVSDANGNWAESTACFYSKVVSGAAWAAHCAEALAAAITPHALPKQQ
jgi:hypothetical protein